MIVTVMLTAIVATFAFAVGAYCAERALLALRRPTRIPWVIATVATIAVPLGQLVALGVRSPETLPVTALPQPLPLVAVVTDAARARLDEGALVLVDRWLLGLWALGSFVLCVRLLIARHALKRVARQWTRGHISGANAWLSERHGPALLGLADPQLVVPRALAQLPPEQQWLAVAHEREHAKCHDQWLARGAVLATVAVPWNPIVWLAARRLRAAIEIDCDARVLRQLPNVRAYAALMLSVASWPRGAAAGALSLGEPAANQLERRLRLMTTRETSRRTFAALAFSGAALALTVYGCDIAVNVQPPEHRLPPPVPEARSADVVSDEPYFEFQVDKPVSPVSNGAHPRYPAILRQAGVEGEVLAQFVVDADGRADVSTFKTLKSSHDLFAQAILSALPAMRFVPAEVGGRAVKQLVQQPFAFRIAR